MQTEDMNREIVESGELDSELGEIVRDPRNNDITVSEAIKILRERIAEGLEREHNMDMDIMIVWPTIAIIFLLTYTAFYFSG